MNFGRILYDALQANPALTAFERNLWYLLGAVAIIFIVDIALKVILDELHYRVDRWLWERKAARDWAGRLETRRSERG